MTTKVIGKIRIDSGEWAKLPLMYRSWAGRFVTPLGGGQCDFDDEKIGRNRADFQRLEKAIEKFLILNHRAFAYVEGISKIPIHERLSVIKLTSTIDRGIDSCNTVWILDDAISAVRKQIQLRSEDSKIIELVTFPLQAIEAGASIYTTYLDYKDFVITKGDRLSHNVAKATLTSDSFLLFGVASWISAFAMELGGASEAALLGANICASVGYGVASAISAALSGYKAFKAQGILKQLSEYEGEHGFEYLMSKILPSIDDMRKGESMEKARERKIAKFKREGGMVAFHILSNGENLDLFKKAQLGETNQEEKKKMEEVSSEVAKAIKTERNYNITRSIVSIVGFILMAAIIWISFPLFLWISCMYVLVDLTIVITKSLHYRYKINEIGSMKKELAEVKEENFAELKEKWLSSEFQFAKKFGVKAYDELFKADFKDREKISKMLFSWKTVVLEIFKTIFVIFYLLYLLALWGGQKLVHKKECSDTMKLCESI